MIARQTPLTNTLDETGTACAICGSHANAVELYPASCDLQALDSTLFSARRMPDRRHGRIVRCDLCGLVRTDPAVDSRVAAELYRLSTFEYGDEAPNLRRTYGRYLARLEAFEARKGALLEVGCGNGFFLEEALARGYQIVRGVEASRDAVRKASDRVRPHIVCDMMRTGLFAPDQFDVTCLFQVFDHLHEPGAMLDECHRTLKPGGLMLLLNHNVDSWSARLLGERSPIVDIEHPYLYGPSTFGRILSAHGFVVKHVGVVLNDYSAYYLARLLPIPAAIKGPLLTGLQRSGLGRVPLRVPLGNMYVVAQKLGRSAHNPAEPEPKRPGRVIAAYGRQRQILFRDVKDFARKGLQQV